MKRTLANSYPIDIFVAGDAADAMRIVKEYCHKHGWCVTVTPTTFVYTGGSETGVRVGIVNYPRFPSLPEILLLKAEELAQLLIEGLYQTSALVQTPEKTLWIHRRENQS